jgi:hypothetical protein
LASLDGFRYFHLMRRVDVDGAPNSGECAFLEFYPFLRLPLPCRRGGEGGGGGIESRSRIFPLP